MGPRRPKSTRMRTAETAGKMGPPIRRGPSEASKRTNAMRLLGAGPRYGRRARDGLTRRRPTSPESPLAHDTKAPPEHYPKKGPQLDGKMARTNT